VSAGRLEGKVALITGGAQGLGAALAQLFTSHGAEVVVTDVLEAEGEALAAELGAAATFAALDVTSEEDWVRAIEHATATFGGVDVLVNNAGIGTLSSIADYSLSEYRRVIDVNQVGVFLGMRAVIPVMASRGGGSIINISSIDGILGMPLTLAYVASKFAVRGMTKVAALEGAPLGIRANSIHPGAMRTPMLVALGPEVEAALASPVPLGRIAEPAEVAALGLFLASDESSYCTGSEFVVDGGVICQVPNAFAAVGAAEDGYAS
jgi:3alpha(or 20beta)-hydroxysteroid dehydrogenase